MDLPHAIDRAEALLAPELPIDLGPHDRERAEELRAQIGRLRDERILSATYEQHLCGGALLQARDAVDALLARVDAPARARWAAIRGEVDAEIRKAFRVRVDTTPRHLTSLRHLDTRSLNGVQRLLRSGGRQVAFVETWGKWVFVRVIDLASQIEQARILLSTPTPIGALGAQVDGDHLIVVGTLGALLELDLVHGNILSWMESAGPERRDAIPARDFMHGDVDLSVHTEVIDDAVLVPGTQLLWRVVQNGRSARRSVHIVDLARRRIVREIATSRGRVFLALKKATWAG